MKRALLVAITLGLALVAPLRPGKAEEERGPVAAIAPPGRIQAQVDVPRRKAAGSKQDVFAPRSWAPPPAPPPKPAPVKEFVGPPEPPPAPQAPPLALVYIGQLDVEGEATVYYLAQGDRVHAVSVGDTINGVYEVLAPEGRALGLMYLPLKIKQLLPLNRPS